MSDGDGPSKESLREVKREYKARRKAEEQRAKDAKAYWDQQTGRSPRRSGARTAGAAALVLATVGVAATGAAVAKVGPFASSSASSSAAGGAPSPTSASPSGSARTSSPTATPSPAPSSSSTPDDGTDSSLVAAFEDTPAASWKPGLAGIALPAGKQIGIYRPRQVADAYAKLKVYLQHVMLDPRVQFQGKLDPVWSTMSAYSRSWIKQQHSLYLTTKGKKGYPYAGLAVRFHPGDWRAAAATRVRGKVTAKPGPKGALELDFTYIAAYWLAPRAGGAPRAIAVRVQGITYVYGNGTRKVGPLDAGFLSIVSSAAACGSRWKYPDYVEAWTDMTQAGGSDVPAVGSGDMTDPDAELPRGCFHDTSGFR